MVDYKITDRPIAGDLTRHSITPVPQITPAEFLQLVDNVLDLPHVKGLIWEQYTPYFNDGDECVFGVHEVRVVLDSEEENDEGERDYEVGHATYDLYDQKWVQGRGFIGEPVYKVGDIDTTEIYVALKELGDSGRWENIARENFGDHAEVTATKDGFSVDYYEHD